MSARLKQGGVFYDLGANAGIFTLPAAKMVGGKGQVVAFEPEPANYHRLLDNVERKQLNNVTVFGFALGSENKSSLLYRPTDRLEEGANSLFKPPDQKGGTSRTPVARLDDVIALWGLQLPQFLKIDVEGAEVQVLEGMCQTLASEKLQTIICEVMLAGPTIEPNRVTVNAVSQLLTNYSFVEVDRAPAGTGGHADILFVEAEK